MKKIFLLMAAVFCLMFFSIASTSGNSNTNKTKSAVTFTKDVAPILQKRCEECHRQGGMAPMSLETYEEARPWARAIKEKIVRREMPPFSYVADSEKFSSRNETVARPCAIGFCGVALCAFLHVAADNSVHHFTQSLEKRMDCLCIAQANLGWAPAPHALHFRGRVPTAQQLVEELLYYCRLSLI